MTYSRAACSNVVAFDVYLGSKTFVELSLFDAPPPIVVENSYWMKTFYTIATIDRYNKQSFNTKFRQHENHLLFLISDDLFCVFCRCFFDGETGEN